MINLISRKSRLASAALLLLLAVLPTSGQTKKDAPEVTDSKKSAADLQNLSPAGAPVGAPVDPKTFKLGPEDVIFVKVWRENDLSGMIMIRPDGKISMPLIGELQGAGRTPVELTKDVTDALSKLMNRPEVFISVQAVNSRKYYMTGEIRKPGAYPMPTPVTVLEAISIAGGLTDLASAKKITVVRGKQRIKFNYKEVIAGKNLAQNIQLESGDHIFIP